MTLPFLSYFKKGKKVAAAKETPAKPVRAPFEKPSGERFSKTVMPNATRTISPQDPFQMASRSSAMGGQPAVATAVTPRTISFVDSPAPRTRAGLPPAVALALEPRVERVISLELADIVAGISADYLKPLGEDASRRILLKASEVEKGMANGKPTVSLATIYQQVPEIFLRTVAPSDTSQVPLPFTKVLDQFTSLHVRGDQERHLAVPQVDTPFLKAAVEDGSRFGTTMEPLEMHPGDLPSVRIEPPTAEAFAAAEPEATAIPPATGSNGNGQGHKTAAQKSTTAPARIPFKLSPNGTDAPAPESVPASSGPSVPNLLPSPPAPVRIPFKMSPPAEEVRPKPEPWLTAETVAVSGETPAEPVSAPTAAPRSSEVKIALALKPILQALAPIQLSGDPGSVPDDARIELPFALIEPQLAVGRISVTAKVFEVSMPAEYRAMFKTGEGAVDVSLPLQEVLKNLPTASLRMRDDQVEQEAGSNFATPFSAKAEEDAKRFNVPATPVAKPVVAEPAPATDTAAATEDVSVETPASDRPFRTPLQVALDTDEKLDAKGIVAQINKIPGVKSCAILFGDGLSLAGTLPAELETDGLCAMAPALMQRVDNHLVDTKLGALRGMTLSCTKGAITFFMRENLCLAALHANVDLPTETREKLGRVVHELSRKYSHPV
jgi:predicted regulator of Ras-like GTPase activity (Roadblock/LC7/MglB family)